MIKALIFDFDGLIFDTESPEVEVWKAIYCEYGLEFPLGTWIRDVVGSGFSTFDPAFYLATHTSQRLDLPALHAHARASVIQALSGHSALPGVNDYLKTAKHLGLRLAVASSSGHAWVEGYLSQLGFLNQFDIILCKEDVQHTKPSPELFKRALEALQVDANEAVVFEDSPNGILAARRAGIWVVAVPNPLTSHGDINAANLVLGSLVDLPLSELIRTVEKSEGSRCD